MTKDSNTGGHPFDASPATAGDETAEALAYRAYRLAQIGREAAPDGDDAAGALAALFEAIGDLALRAHFAADALEARLSALETAASQ
ncbi:MAG: hypothetical protein JKP97_06240 [Rhodobacteraceae bacterium]|jgi:hypothetical protein|nr:hypothetical protein [Paracoccaceae bacterium]